MAKIIYGAGIAAISGSIAGMVFNKNGTVRNKGFATNSNTQKQQDTRALFAEISTQWRGLTSAQQASFATMAPQYKTTNNLSQVRQLTGFQLFMKLSGNGRVLMSSQGLITDVSGNGQTILTSAALVTPEPPEEFSSTRASTVVVELSEDLTGFSMDLVMNQAPDANERVAVFATAPLGNGVTKPSKSMFRRIGVFQGDGVREGMSLDVNYGAVFGQPALGSKIFFRTKLGNVRTWQVIDAGQVSSIVTQEPVA